MKENVFDERICPVCGKHFFKPVESIYKFSDKGKHIRYACSYSCWVRKLKELGKW